VETLLLIAGIVMIVLGGLLRRRGKRGLRARWLRLRARVRRAGPRDFVVAAALAVAATLGYQWIWGQVTASLERERVTVAAGAVTAGGTALEDRQPTRLASLDAAEPGKPRRRAPRSRSVAPSRRPALTAAALPMRQPAAPRSPTTPPSAVASSAPPPSATFASNPRLSAARVTAAVGLVPSGRSAPSEAP
jgi:hypothetical protein